VELCPPSGDRARITVILGALSLVADSVGGADVPIGIGALLDTGNSQTLNRLGKPTSSTSRTLRVAL